MMSNRLEGERRIPLKVVNRLQHHTTQADGFLHVARIAALQEATEGRSVLSEILPPGRALRESFGHARKATRIMVRWGINHPER